MPGTTIPYHGAKTAADDDSKSSTADALQGAPSELSLQVVPSQVMKLLTAIVLLLIILSTIAHTFLGAVPENEHRAVREVAMRFDMDRENTIPAWFSSMLLVGCGLLLARIGLHYRQSRQPFACHWLVLAAVFIYLSIDESTALHEILIVPLRRRFNAGGILYFSWVIVALPLVTVMLLAYLRFLRSLAPRTRWLFVLAGGLYVGGALGMELIGGLLAEHTGFYTARYTLVMTIEESLEMLGASLFLCALIDFVGKVPGINSRPSTWLTE